MPLPRNAQKSGFRRRFESFAWGHKLMKIVEFKFETKWNGVKIILCLLSGCNKV